MGVAAVTGAALVLVGTLGQPAMAATATTVVGWVAPGYSGQASPPTGLSDAVAVAGGEWHAIALRSNGTVVGWGNNAYGKASSPAGLTGVVAIAAGSNHNLALRRNGTVVAWGDNSYGQTDVPADLTHVVAIDGGVGHSLALKSNGRVVAWGDDSYGQTDVPAGLTDVVAIAAGYNHNLAVKSDGTVVGWGRNDYGQASSPAGLTGVVAAAAGWGHSLVLKRNGTVVAWGYNAYNQLAVPAGLSSVVAISVGEQHNLALKSNGTVVGWGLNNDGQATPPPGLTGVVGISAGGLYSLAVVSRPATTVQYGGAYLATVGDPLTVRATLTSPAIGCVTGRAVTFTLTRGATSYAATDTTGGKGQAVATLSTKGWAPGAYDVTVIVAGTAACPAGSTAAAGDVLTVARATDLADGGGWYNWKSSGANRRVNVGFTVRQNPTTHVYNGDLTLVNSGAWRLTGTVTDFSRTGTTSGRADGNGTLTRWACNTLNGVTTCRWASPQSTTFRIAFTDGATDTFGLVDSGYANPTLPKSSPKPLKAGDIRLQ